jgi:hypothetical protein
MSTPRRSFSDVYRRSSPRTRSSRMCVDRGWIFTVSRDLEGSSAGQHTPVADDMGMMNLGPFWILTTLILTIYLSTSLSTALSAGNTSSDTPTDKDLTLLTFITTLIYLYGLAFPAAFWGVVRYLALKTGGNEGGSEGAAGWSLPEAWAVWGYGMVVWVPISVSLMSCSWA